MISLAVRKDLMKTKTAALVSFFLKVMMPSSPYWNTTNVQMNPPAMSTPSQEGVRLPSRNYCIIRAKNPTGPSFNASVHFNSLSDGSYVSVPSPLGKIKSMTKGSEVEWSMADFSHTLHHCQLTWQHTLSVKLMRDVSYRSVSDCALFTPNIHRNYWSE